jgi:hypothetical protein
VSMGRKSANNGSNQACLGPMGQSVPCVGSQGQGLVTPPLDLNPARPCPVSCNRTANIDDFNGVLNEACLAPWWGLIIPPNNECNIGKAVGTAALCQQVCDQMCGTGFPRPVDCGLQADVNFLTIEYELVVRCCP